MKTSVAVFVSASVMLFINLFLDFNLTHSVCSSNKHRPGSVITMALPHNCPVLVCSVVNVNSVPIKGKKVKGQTIPLQAWTSLYGSRRLRLPDFKTIGTRRW
jgi:hypothetical protein